MACNKSEDFCPCSGGWYGWSGLLEWGGECTGVFCGGDDTLRGSFLRLNETGVDDPELVSSVPEGEDPEVLLDLGFGLLTTCFAIS